MAHGSVFPAICVICRQRMPVVTMLNKQAVERREGALMSTLKMMAHHRCAYIIDRSCSADLAAVHMPRSIEPTASFCRDAELYWKHATQTVCDGTYCRGKAAIASAVPEPVIIKKSQACRFCCNLQHRPRTSHRLCGVAGLGVIRDRKSVV